MTTGKYPTRELILTNSYHAAARFRNPVVSALLALAILLGKAIVCRYAPGRTVFFDAMLIVPISMFAYHEGLIMGLVAGLVASAADVVMSAKMAELLIPAYWASGVVRMATVARLFSLEVVAAIVAMLSRRARHDMIKADKRTKKYLKKISLLEDYSAAIEEDARGKEAEFERNLLKYSSLVYLLEESAQKIYSSLEIERLFQSLFRVLEECFGSTCASIYLRDARNGSYFLASASGGDNAPSDAIPMMLRPEEPQLAELMRTRRATCWHGEDGTDALGQRDRSMRAIASGALVDKADVVGVVNIHTVDRPAPPDVMLLGVVCNIASIALANARLFSEVQWLAEQDPLTKLYNRRTFHQQLESQLSIQGANSGQFALLMLDIDHFKSFNDTYGHQAGDAVLEWFARHCEEWTGEANLVFRYGGEEFTVIMPNTDADAAGRLAEQVRKRVENTTFEYDGNELKVMLSCGVAVFPANGTTADGLIRKADRALYRAKGAGRNAVVVSETGPGHDTAIVPYEVQMATSRTARPTNSRPGATGGGTARRPAARTTVGGRSDGGASPAKPDESPGGRAAAAERRRRRAVL